MNVRVYDRPIPATVERTLFTWLKRDFWTFGPNWQRISAKVSPIDACQFCQHQFSDGERLNLAGRVGKTNLIVCDGCADRIEALPETVPEKS